MTTLFFDGLAEPTNPGHACYGWIVLDDEKAIGQGSDYIGSKLTNNIAEYRALIEGLKYCAEHAIELDAIHGDSQLVVNQVNGAWRCNFSHLRELRDQAKNLIAHMTPQPFLGWVPREQNSRADELSANALPKHIHRRRR